MLTNYDRYVLERQQKQNLSDNQKINNTKYTSDNPMIPNDNNTPNNIVTENHTDPYDVYLLNELRRTQASANKVLTKEEFYACNNASGVDTAENVKAKEGKGFRFQFSKKAKLILAIYVIIMVAVASILIIVNTNSTTTSYDGLSFNQSAGASSYDGTDSDSNKVRPMTIEEDDNDKAEKNWFDRFCDSLNK